MYIDYQSEVIGTIDIINPASFFTGSLEFNSPIRDFKSSKSLCSSSREFSFQNFSVCKIPHLNKHKNKLKGKQMKTES